MLIIDLVPVKLSNKELKICNHLQCQRDVNMFLPYVKSEISCLIRAKNLWANSNLSYISGQN